MNRIVTSFCLLLLTATTVLAGECAQGNCRNGFGTYIWHDGSTFTGSFVNGKPDGEGKYVDPGGRKFHILYVDGEPVTSTPVTPEEEAIEHRHKEAERYNEAGLLYLQKKEYESAIFFFNKAITYWPDNPNYLRNYHLAKERKP